MNFGEAIRSVFSQYATFSGRARRSEYWYWALFQWLAMVGLMLVSGVFTMAEGSEPPMTGMTMIGVFFIAMILPTIAVSVRRMHDMDRVGWWILVALVPYIGGLILFVWFMFPGTSGRNRFGPDPLGGFDDDGGEPATHQSSIPSVRR